MTKSMPISKARVNLGSVVNSVRKNGDQIILEKNNIPVAVIINIDDWEDYMELNDPEIQKQIDESYADYKAGRLIPAEEVFAEMRKKYPIEK